MGSGGPDLAASLSAGLGASVFESALAGSSLGASAAGAGRVLILDGLVERHVTGVLVLRASGLHRRGTQRRTGCGLRGVAGGHRTHRAAPKRKPRPKKRPHSATRPKKRASILPVPSVISVSCEPILSPEGVSPSRTEKVAPIRLLPELPPSPLPSIFCRPEKKSTGTGKMTVVFFSTPISVRVCK